MLAEEQAKSSPGGGRSAVRSGLVTGLSFIVVSTAGAVAGAYLAHKFGRNTRTDGFLAAYGVYLVLVLGAQAFRMVVVPDLTRAAREGRLGAEFRGYAVTFLAVGVPATVAVAVAPHFWGELITGRLPDESARLAGDSLVWLVPAAFTQLLAALAASALAAQDSYATAAAGFALGGAASVTVFVSLAGSHGLVALAWALMVAAATAFALPAAALAWRARGFGLRDAHDWALRRRLARLLNGVAVPFALQGLYVIALRFAAGTGEGNVTSLSYAYLLAGMFVTATAFSLSLISAAPLTRRGVDAEGAAAHVVHSAWVALALVGAAAGLVGLVGGSVVTAALGNAYSGEVGRELGRLVVYLAPWMVAWSAFSITYPILFVMHRTRFLIPLAVAAVLIDVPISFVARSLGGLTGVALALGITTFVLVVGLTTLVSTRTLWLTMVGLGRLSLVVGAAAALAFGGASLVLSSIPAAFAGLALYAALLFASRQAGLGEAWQYVRALH